MALHFSEQEFADRRAKLVQSLEANKLDGILCFAQESMYWLTGYDTFGFCFFQCLYINRDGSAHLLTRSADLRQAEHTSNIKDIRLWQDSASASPAEQLRDMLTSLGAQGKTLAIETDTHGLTYANGKSVFLALDGFCTLQENNKLVPRLRAVKSAEEIAYVRRAGELADNALNAALSETKSGADEADILAAMQGAIFKGGGDYPGNEFIIGSGEDALLCRYKTGRRKLNAQDQLTLEFAGTYRHYHAALMRTLIIGQASARHVELYNAAHDALMAVEAMMQPGKTAGDVFAAHAQVLDQAGLSAHRLNACGYSLGARFTPSWMDVPMFYADNPWVLEQNMVLFAHMILMDSDSKTAMCLGRTSVISAKGAEPLSKAPLDMIVCA